MKVRLIGAFCSRPCSREPAAIKSSGRNIGPERRDRRHLVRFMQDAGVAEAFAELLGGTWVSFTLSNQLAGSGLVPRPEDLVAVAVICSTGLSALT